MSEKSTLKGGVVRVQGRIFKFKTPYLNLERGEAKNFKFGTRIDLGKSHFKHDKIPQKGRSHGPVIKNWILNPLP